MNYLLHALALFTSFFILYAIGVILTYIKGILDKDFPNTKEAKNLLIITSLVLNWFGLFLPIKFEK